MPTASSTIWLRIIAAEALSTYWLNFRRRARFFGAGSVRLSARAGVEAMQAQRRAVCILLERVGEPAGGAGDREDGLTGTAGHAADAGENRQGEVHVDLRQAALPGLVEHGLGDHQFRVVRCHRPDAVEQRRGPPVGGFVHRVPQAGYAFSAAQPLPT